MGFDWAYSIALAWIIGSILLLLLLWQFYFIFKDDRLSSRRKSIRALLNLLFIGAITGFILQPTFPISERNSTIIAYSDEVKNEHLDSLKNERDIRRAIPIDRLAKEDLKVIAFGNQWTKEQLSTLRLREVEWVPLDQKDALLNLKWKAILYQGEKQKIEAEILATSAGILPLMDGELLIDSITLVPGFNTIELEVPIKTLGRNSWNLIDYHSDTLEINFYSIERPPASYLMLQSFPTTEFRVLAQWLGKQNSKVEIVTQTSADASVGVSINQSDSSDILIADPSFVSDARVREILQKGGTVFFPITQPEMEISKINQQLETDFTIQKLSDEEKVKISNNIDALPFSFGDKASQKQILDNKVALENIGTGKVMLSLLWDTYPIQFAGDSIRYHELWTELSNEMLPAADINWQIAAPLIQDFPEKLAVNTRIELPQILPQNEDSIYYHTSTVNPFNYFSEFNFPYNGWQAFADSLEVYVYSQDELPLQSGRKKMINFIKDHHQEPINTQLSKKLPKGVWLGILLILAMLLWIEPKV
ncbi:hypothetical protein ACFCT7_15760 [Fulvivirgaceae bacterium LMO-SS25]